MFNSLEGKLEFQIRKRLVYGKLKKFHLFFDENLPDYLVFFDHKTRTFSFSESGYLASPRDFLVRMVCAVQQLIFTKKSLFVLLHDGYDIGEGVIAGESRHEANEFIKSNDVLSQLVTYSDNIENSVKLFDPYFFQEKGYRKFHNNSKWELKEKTVFWRGATTGDKSPLQTQRAEMCKMLRSSDVSNVKLAILAQTDDYDRDLEALKELQIWGERVKRKLWYKYQFVIDVDGNTNSWSNIIHKSVQGLCTIKIQSSKNFQQWFYEDLSVGVTHYEVASNLSNLVETVDDAVENQKKSRELAITAKNIFRNYSLKSELQRVVANINNSF